MFPPVVLKGSNFSISSPKLFCCCCCCHCFDRGHSNIDMRWYLILDFDLHFLKDQWCWASFHIFMVIYPPRVVKYSPANAGDIRDPGLILLRKIPWRRKWRPTPVFLPGESHEQRSLWATTHGVTKSWTQLIDQAWAWCFSLQGMNKHTHEMI